MKKRKDHTNYTRIRSAGISLQAALKHIGAKQVAAMVLCIIAAVCGAGDQSSVLQIIEGRSGAAG